MNDDYLTGTIVRIAVIALGVGLGVGYLTHSPVAAWGSGIIAGLFVAFMMWMKR